MGAFAFARFDAGYFGVQSLDLVASFSDSLPSSVASVSSSPCPNKSYSKDRSKACRYLTLVVHVILEHYPRNDIQDPASWK